MTSSTMGLWFQRQRLSLLPGHREDVTDQPAEPLAFFGDHFEPAFWLGRHVIRHSVQVGLQQVRVHADICQRSPELVRDLVDEADSL